MIKLCLACYILTQNHSMKKISIYFALMIASALFFSACSKTGATGPAGSTGPAGPSLSGTLEGYVDLFDEYGDLQGGTGGVYVTVPGKTDTSFTASTGMFTKNLTTGTYELDFGKSGYGSLKAASVNFVGGGTQYINNHFEMTKPATWIISGLSVGSATVAGAPVASASVTVGSTDTRARKAICFYSKTAGVSNTPGTYLGSFIINIPANALNGVANLSTANANAAGVQSGDAIYLIAYPIAVNNSASTYADISTGKTVYNNINAASSVTATAVFP